MAGKGVIQRIASGAALPRVGDRRRQGRKSKQREWVNIQSAITSKVRQDSSLN